MLDCKLIAVVWAVVAAEMSTYGVLVFDAFPGGLLPASREPRQTFAWLSARAVLAARMLCQCFVRS
ncbi:MAG: hypothetical protein WB558_10590, partial [Terriglobales bacterium]